VTLLRYFDVCGAIKLPRDAMCGVWRVYAALSACGRLCAVQVSWPTLQPSTVRRPSSLTSSGMQRFKTRARFPLGSVAEHARCAVLPYCGVAVCPLFIKQHQYSDTGWTCTCACWRCSEIYCVWDSLHQPASDGHSDTSWSQSEGRDDSRSFSILLLLSDRAPCAVAASLV